MWRQYDRNYDNSLPLGISSHWGQKARSSIELQSLRESATRASIQKCGLLLLNKGKVTNLSVEERIAFMSTLRNFTRRVVIQRRVEDLLLGVEKLSEANFNLTKPTRTDQSKKTRASKKIHYSESKRTLIYENDTTRRTD
ncbi:hypothetical protein Tco_0039565 [Tanacetum coccineum]